MASTIVTKNSSTASAVPVTGDLTQGELAVNVTDKKLYTKDSGGTVVKLVGGLGNQEANAVAITGGSINGTTVGATTASTGAFTTLSASSTVSGTGFSTYLASPPAIGGTTAAAGSFTTLSASGNTTLSGGTANGVAYLNGSKVVTTGSALTFDGTNLGLSSSAVATAIKIDGSGRYKQLETYQSGSREFYFGYDSTSLIGLIYQDNNRPIAFGISGSEQMRLTSTGLGIGTSSPAAKLDVLGSSGDQIRVRTAGTEFYRFGRNSGTGFLDFYGSQTGYQGYTFGGVDGTWMTINSSGNLGIGTSSPSQKLTVSGSAAFSRIGFNANAIDTVSTSQSFVRFQSTGADFYLGTESSTGGAFFPGSTAYAAVLYNANSTPMHFYTNAGLRMTLDSSGNLGLGVTPSAWSGLTSFSIASTGSNISSASNDNLFITSGAYYNGTNWIYKATSQAVSQYNQLGGAHKWYYAASGTAGNAITFTQAMTLDASGNLGLGTTSPKANSGYATLTLNNATNGGVVQFTQADTTIGQLFFDGNGGTLRTSGSTSLVFGTANTERARITSGGEVYIAGTTDQGAYNLQVNGTGVWGAGAYVNGSDARLKEEVQDLAPALDVIASLRPVTFRYKEDYSKDQNVQPGFIAQELQTAMAGQAYVDGVIQSGPQHLNVAYQSLIPLLTKAIQELKAEFDAYKATHP